MTIQEFRIAFNKKLSSLYPKNEVDTFLFLLLEYYCNKKRIDVIIDSNYKIESENLDKLNAALNRLIKEEPIQYIIGETEFFGLPFKVNKHTLIPRPETEELVEWVLETIKNQNQLKSKESIHILDIGTGTGCIAISLAKNINNAQVSAIDISNEALEIAQGNAKLNQVNIHFIKRDILKTRNLDKKFDIIVSNPPYVRNLEKKEIKKNVLENEPHAALFVEDDNPLIFYDAISKLAHQTLTENGFLFFEINEYLGKEMLKLLEDKNFKNPILKKDLFGKDRMIRASFI